MRKLYSTIVVLAAATLDIAISGQRATESRHRHTDVAT